MGGGKKRDHPPLYDIVPRGDPGEYFVPGMVVGRNVFFSSKIKMHGENLEPKTLVAIPPTYSRLDPDKKVGSI